MKIIGHRGLYRDKENTFESIVEINNKNCSTLITGVEFDVQITSDGILICYHDFDLKRIHSVSKLTRNISHEEVTAYNITKLDDIIVHFSTHLDSINNIHNMIVDIEVKIDPELPDELFQKFVNKFAKAINELSCQVKSICLITSFNLDFLKETIKRVTGLQFGYIIDDKLDSLDDLKSIGIDAIILNKDLVDQQQLSDLTQNFDVYLYTFFNNTDTYAKDRNFIQTLKNCNFNIGIITDKFEETLALIKD